MAKTKIQLEIDCEEKMCGNCHYKLWHSTGLVGEFHSVCEVFDGHYGDWGAMDMKRARRCITAQKKASNALTQATRGVRLEMIVKGGIDKDKLRQQLAEQVK